MFLFISFRTYSIKLYCIFVNVSIFSLSFSSLNIGKISLFTKYGDFYLKAFLQNCWFVKNEQNRAADFSCTIGRHSIEYIMMLFGSGLIELHIHLSYLNIFVMAVKQRMYFIIVIFGTFEQYIRMNMAFDIQPRWVLANQPPKLQFWNGCYPPTSS